MKQILKKYTGIRHMLKLLAFVLFAAVSMVYFSTPACADFAESLKEDFISCWTCEIAAGLLNIMGYVAYEASDQIFAASWRLMAVGLGLWLVLTTIRHMNPANPMNLGGYIGEISGKLFAALFISAFFGAFSVMGHPSQMYDVVVRPVFQISQELCMDFIYADMGGAVPTRITTIGNDVFAGAPGVNDINPVTYRPDNIFEEDDIKKSVMVMASVIIRLSESMFNALTVLSQSMVNSESDTPRAREFAAAIVIIIPYLWMLFVAHFTIADMFIRFAIVGALLPLLMAAYVFPFTRQKFTIVGFKVVMNSAIVIVLLGVFIGILSSVIERNIDGGPLDLGLPRIIETDTSDPNAALNIIPGPVDMEEAATQIANPNSEQLWLSIFLPWLMLGAIRTLYSWGDKFGANIGQARMAMATGSLFAAAVTPKATITNLMSPTQKMEEKDPLANQRDPEGDGRHGDEHERRTGL